MKSTARVLGILIAASACSPPQADADAAIGPGFLRGRSVVLIVADSLHAAHLSSYGYARGTTPHIDRLAEDGRLFTQAYSQSSWTLPSVASLFTSLEQEQHGLRHLGSSLEQRFSTLAECLAAGGYDTCAVLQNPILSSSVGLLRGFDSIARLDWTARDAERAVEQALDHLRSARTRPLFLYLHLVPPHMPYQPPAPFRGRYGGATPAAAGSIADCRRIHKAGLAPEHADVRRLVDLYDEHIAYMDATLGPLLSEIEGLPRDQRPLVVFTSDHGEAFMQHGRQGHNATVFDEMVRVPLVLWAPDRFTPGVIESPVSLLDLMPSLLEWAGLALPEHALSGTPLSATMRGLAPSGRTLFLSSRYKDDPSRLHLGVRRGSNKLVLWSDAEGARLFDLASDPGETLDVKEQHPELARELERALLSWHAGRVDSTRAGDVRTDSALEALGYTQH